MNGNPNRRRSRRASLPLALLLIACQSERAPQVGPVAAELRIAKLRLDKVP